MNTVAQFAAAILLSFLLSCREAEDSLSSDQDLGQTTPSSIVVGAELEWVANEMKRIGGEDISYYIGYRSERILDIGETPSDDDFIFEDKFYDYEGRVYWLVFTVRQSVGTLDSIRVADSAEKLARKQETWSSVDEIPFPEGPSS